METGKTKIIQKNCAFLNFFDFFVCIKNSGGPLNYVLSLDEEIKIQRENRAKNQAENNSTTNTEKPSVANGENGIDAGWRRWSQHK